MKNLKNLTVLLLITVAAIAGAALSMQFRRPDDTPPLAKGRLFEDLESRINEVARLQIRTGEGSVTLARNDGEWVIEECSGYAAKTEKVREAIWKVAEFEIEAAKTKLPSKYAQLGVEGIDAEDSQSSEIHLWNAAGEELAGIIVGKTEYRRGGQSVYLRKVGGEQAFECRGRVDFRTDVRSWADVLLTRIPTARVKSVTIRHGNGEVVELERLPGEGDRFRVANLPGGRSEKYEGVGSSVAGTLSGLELDEVRTVAEMPFDQGDETVTGYETIDGLKLLIRSRKVEEKTWIHIAARADEPVGPPMAPEPPPEESLDPEGETTPAAPAVDEAFLARSKEADELNARLGPWVFAISSYKADSLRKPMEELLAELPEVVPSESVLPTESGLPTESEPPTEPELQSEVIGEGGESSTDENDG
jgi:hypothetical protein